MPRLSGHIRLTAEKDIPYSTNLAGRGRGAFKGYSEPVPRLAITADTDSRDSLAIKWAKGIIGNNL